MSERDMNWLKDLYNTHYESIFKLVLWRIKDCPSCIDDAHDITQDIFLLALKKDLRGHPNPAGWLFIAAELLCKNHLRKDHRRKQNFHLLEQQHIAYQQNPAQHPFESACDGAIEACDLMLAIKSRLSESDFSLLMEYCVRGTPIEDISRNTGQSVNCLRVRIYRIRKIVESLLIYCVITTSVTYALNKFTSHLQSLL